MFATLADIPDWLAITVGVVTVLGVVVLAAWTLTRSCDPFCGSEDNS